MQTTSRKTDIRTKKESKEEPIKKQDERPKKSVYTVSTPRDFVQKSTTADIYAQKKKSNAQNVTKAPKKVPGITNINNTSPMKGLLKSSASSVSQISRTDTPKKNDAKTLNSVRRNETPRKPVTNVTVNSPAVKRRLALNPAREKEAGSSRKSERSESTQSKEPSLSLYKQTSNVNKTKEVSNDLKEVVKERKRTKTRTLDEDEVKILKSEIIDNNAGMINLSQKLIAQPKAFYVEFDEDKPKLKKDKSSDEDVSYEDDFESYESDFESYHSDLTDSGGTSETSKKSEPSRISESSERNEGVVIVDESSLKEKDEEKMLDSGNFDLRDQRSAKSKPLAMDFILEDSEDRKTVSLTDEGFQDMSSSSAGSSLKTQQADRNIFIDLTKSKQNKLKRKIHERLQQRAKDLLGMITLHEMSYSLFEMQPISYDLYMATFGRSNYTQIGVQTFDDGVTEEIQTDEIVVSQKWTQHPVEFSKSDIYMTKDILARKYSKHTEDYLTKFTFMLKTNVNNQNDRKINVDENYKSNPLRVFLEQKDGAGNDEMLPYETYKSKLKSNDYSTNKLAKFLKKFESKISHALSSNIGDKDVNNLSKSNKIPFSKGYFSLSSKRAEDGKLSFLKYAKVTRVIFSETKANLILTIHKKSQSLHGKRILICLWDLSVARAEPTKYLTAIDDIVIGRFRGNVNGVFVAALDDGSIHLWDLSEEPTWRNDDGGKNNEFVKVDCSKLTDMERDREWNLKNSHIGFDQPLLSIALQSCAFTSSGGSLHTTDEIDCIVGLEMDTDVRSMETGRRVVGQIVSLQRVGILTIWSIIQDKLQSSKDIGKAYLSKLKLEKCQTIHIRDHIDIYSKRHINGESSTSFNLNAAKRRLSLKKKEKSLFKTQNSRPQSAVSSKLDFDFDRPSSAASMRKKILPVEINLPKNWETGVMCYDLRIMRIENVDNYLVAKNCGEVLCCKRCLGAVKIERFTIATDTSSVTNLEVSNKGLPYFLAATDTGTVNLCSLLDNRVLLTLDCSERSYEEWSITTYLVILDGKPNHIEFDMTRNIPTFHDADKCMSDSKGRFISSVTSRKSADTVDRPVTKLEIKSVHWSPVNPCTVHVLLHDSTVVLFELTHSDIYAKYVCENAASQCSANDYHLALLTPEGEVQVHRLLTNESQTKANLNVFEKYVALL